MAQGTSTTATSATASETSDTAPEASATEPAPTAPSVTFDGSHLHVEGLPAMSGNGRRALFVAFASIYGNARSPTTDAFMLDVPRGAVLRRFPLLGAYQDLSSTGARHVEARVAALNREIAAHDYRPLDHVALWPSTDDRRRAAGPSPDPAPTAGNPWSVRIAGRTVWIQAPDGRPRSLELVPKYGRPATLTTAPPDQIGNIRARPCLRTVLSTPESIDVWMDRPTGVVVAEVLYSGINGCEPGMVGHPVADAVDTYVLTAE